MRIEKNKNYIKFKVWDFDTKEWISDKEDFAINENGLYIIHPEGEWALVDYHYKYKNIEICQYTEFKDCNGDPIFYGDILKAKTSELYVVQKGRGDTLDGDSGFGYILHSISKKYIYSENKILLHTCFATKNKKIQFYKKIGNKYENPELLDKERCKWCGKKDCDSTIKNSWPKHGDVCCCGGTIKFIEIIGDCEHLYRCDNCLEEWVYD